MPWNKTSLIAAPSFVLFAVQNPLEMFSGEVRMSPFCPLWVNFYEIFIIYKWQSCIMFYINLFCCCFDLSANSSAHILLSHYSFVRLVVFQMNFDLAPLLMPFTVDKSCSDFHPTFYCFSSIFCYPFFPSQIFIWQYRITVSQKTPLIVSHVFSMSYSFP